VNSSPCSGSSATEKVGRRSLTKLILVSAIVTAFGAGKPTSTSVPLSAQGCLRYEPDTVAVTGILTRVTFPGPPNYESIKDGDEPETGFYLRLEAPICTTASPDSADNNGALQDVRLVQLVLDQAAYAHLRPHLGRRITLHGSLFAAVTGHHHAPLLLQAVSGP
jgi:hypothetical protein